MSRAYGISKAEATNLIKMLQEFLILEKGYATNPDICLDFMFADDTAFMVKTGFYDYPVNYCPVHDFVWPINKQEVMKSFAKIGLRKI